MGQVAASTVMQYVIRFGVPLLILAVCLGLLSQEFSTAELANLPGHLRDITALQWAMAGGLTLASFWAVGQYDALAHRALGTGISARHARLTGTIGIALGQTLGFGLLTGALARWRMLPGLSAACALRLSTYVSLSFIMAWVVVTSLVCIVLPAPNWTMWPALSGVIVAALSLWFLFRRPVLHWRGHTLPMPSLTLTAAFVFWAALDTTFASAAFFVFVPDPDLQFATFLPLFLVALGAALVSNTPGGIGPFELILLTALPQAAPEAVMTSIIAYRLVYYALPAGIAMLALLRPFALPRVRLSFATGDHRIGPRSEVGAVLQNGGFVHRDQGSSLALWPTGQTVTLFADPVQGTTDMALAQLTTCARAAVKFSFIYKCGGPMAATARKAGWSVIHMADDAIIDLATYDHALPSRRTLRRKLRAREKAGVRIVCDTTRFYAEMADVDAAWQEMHGTARGGSMGRLSAPYIQDQWVACAYHDNALVAFITVHVGHDDWCLDIMRHVKDVPEGTMHGLVDAAILAARDAGIDQFCLAATPACPNPKSALWRWVARQAVARSGGPGLRQFKSAFAPRWSARYAAAPNHIQLALGLADLTQEILDPIPLTQHESNQPHYVDEDYEVDSQRCA
ncbi:phosphatidylglycerol lysyltransferase domain-containing protein [Tateyamaria pelophila]|uniref:phosphatidylglycerol lysyltransferase domain-containing protein n=1 Tax=Tateyamaria pelophila TaxID=328415 RepID=UPI001CBDF3EC|nr:phosphatidylglycerol lysyltransferase domain-containing protein [Tateyamaria pelophila]